jgi:hypothetical protein
MADPDHFEHLGSRGFYRPLGVVTFEQAVETVAVGIEHAQKLGLKDLLVNTQALTGFAVPTTFGRYAFAVRWAQAGGGVLLIDHEKIGMIMAQNRGLDVDVFTNEADAIGWLDSRAAARR